MKSIVSAIILTLIIQVAAFGQRAEWQGVALDDLSAFQEQAGNWRIVGGITMDPSINVKDVAASGDAVAEWAALSKRDRKKRLKSGGTEPVELQVLYPEPGTGVLLNDNNKQQRDNLFTSFEHGDMELEVEVMVPNNSNSGFYFQGRYEIQVRDSWGKQNISFGDMGSIYRSWGPEYTYMGKPGDINAAKAPGLWQHLKAGFRAPRFNEQGEKVENARFVYVELNGIRIHENVEVPSPTRAAELEGEVPTGPLMIQGDHGPVAIRNLRYRMLQQQPVQLADVSYRLYEGNFMGFSEFEGKTPDYQGKLQELTINVPGATSAMALEWEGSIEVPKAGTYDLRFNYSANGGDAFLKIGDKVVGEEFANKASIPFRIKLAAGKTPFHIKYFRSSNWSEGVVGIYSYGSYPVPLHGVGSYLPAGEPAKNQLVFVEPEKSPRLLRAFLDFKNDGDQRLTHTLGVGGTSKRHFVYDLKTGTPVCAWSGPFVNATPMWDGRGDGSFKPRGAVQWLFTGHSVAVLPEADAAFPEQLSEDEGFANLGYSIAEGTGLPVFRYTRGGTEFHDSLQPDESGRYLVRKINFKEAPADTSGWYIKLAEGEAIEKAPNGYFVVDQQWYVAPEGFEPVVRTIKGKKELIAPLPAGGLQYGIIW